MPEQLQSPSSGITLEASWTRQQAQPKQSDHLNSAAAGVCPLGRKRASLRWLKHLSMAHADEKIDMACEQFGAEAYGVWWLILEDIAAPMEPGKMRPIASHSDVKWASICRCSVRHWRSIAKIFADLSLISMHSTGDRTTIEVPNLLKYRDEWSKRSGGSPEPTTTTTTADPHTQPQPQQSTRELAGVKPVSDYPQTTFSVREKFPETDDMFVMRLVQNSVQAVLSLNGQKLLGEVSDELIAEAVRRSWTKSQKSAGLFLRTVPQCVKTFLTQELPPAFRDDPSNWVCGDCGCGPQCFCNGSPEPVNPEKRKKPNGKVARLHGSAV